MLLAPLAITVNTAVVAEVPVNGILARDLAASFSPLDTEDVVARGVKITYMFPNDSKLIL